MTVVARHVSQLRALEAEALCVIREVVAELAAAEQDGPIPAERIATTQGIPLNSLENILSELRAAGLVRSARGLEARKNLRTVVEPVTIADVARQRLPDVITQLASDPEAWVTRATQRGSD